MHNKRQFVNNPKIQVSLHAKEKFLEIMAPDISPKIAKSDRLKFAEDMIRDAWKSAAYFMDNKDGIIFCNSMFSISLFVRNGCITKVTHIKSIIKAAA